MIRILGIDPGGTTGYCLLDSDRANNKFTIIDAGEIREDKFYGWLQNWIDYNIDSDYQMIVVCEDWIQRPKFDGKWTKQPVAEQIGAIKFNAHRMSCIFVITQASDKPRGYAAAGMKYVKGKQGTHIEDATAHAFYVAKYGYTAKQRRF